MIRRRAKTRWKRIAPRYDVRWVAKARQLNTIRIVTVSNISKGGLLLTIPRDAFFLEDLPTTISVTYRGNTLDFSGRLVHFNFSEDSQLFGFEFAYLEPKTEIVLTEWLRLLASEEANRYPEPINSLVTILARGLNLFREIQRRPGKKAPRKRPSHD